MKKMLVLLVLAVLAAFVCSDITITSAAAPAMEGKSNPLTRAEAAVMICEMLDADLTEYEICSMADVTVDHPAHAEIGYLCSHGIMESDPDGFFHPDEEITSRELLVAMCNISEHFVAVIAEKAVS